MPIFLGGDHSISAPIIQACKEVYEDLVVIHFDAHTDLAPWNYLENHHHGNVMSRVLQENPGIEIYQFGIRGFAGASLNKSQCHQVGQREINAYQLHRVSQLVPKGQICYISLDVDVLDPSFAPGTGTPVPMGMSPPVLLSLLESIAVRNNIVGIDIVELCPALDRNDMTSNLVLHILMCFLGKVSRKT